MLVINKADRPGVENTERALRSNLELAHPTKRVVSHHGRSVSISISETSPAVWIPPIHKTVATEGKGIAELAESIAEHAAHLHQSGDWAARDRARLGSGLEAVLGEALMTRFHENISQEKYEEIIEQVLSRSLSPWEAVQSLLNGSAK